MIIVLVLSITLMNHLEKWLAEFLLDLSFLYNVLFLVPHSQIHYILFSSVSKESVVDVSATVSPVEFSIESCSVKMVELHVHEFWVVSSAKIHLPLLIEDASRRISADEVNDKYEFNS